MSDGELILLALGGIVAVLVVLWLAFQIALLGVWGFGVMFGLAVEHGAPGLILYLLLWVFATPVMLVVSVIIGWVRYQDEKAQEHEG